MAEGRFLSRSISTNEQLAGVSLEAALLFSWCIPHLDVDGRLAGNPMFLKSNVVPLRDEITLKKIPRLLTELARAVDRTGQPLLIWYEAGRQQVLQFPGFAGQQKGLRKDREAPSKLPPVSEAIRILAGAAPPQLRDELREQLPPNRGSNSRSDAGVSPAQGEGEVEVQGEENAKKNPPTPRARDSLFGRLAPADNVALDQLLTRVKNPEAWQRELEACLDGMPGHVHVSPKQLGVALRDYVANGALENPGAHHFRAYLQRAKRDDDSPPNGEGPPARRAPRSPNGANPGAQGYANAGGSKQ